MVAPDAELTKRHAEIPAWDDMPDELKPVLARQMEVYAAFLEHTDRHVGRLIDALKDLEALDNTLVFYIIGDNGASAEGSLNGTFNELCMLNGLAAVLPAPRSFSFAVRTVHPIRLDAGLRQPDQAAADPNESARAVRSQRFGVRVRQ